MYPIGVLVVCFGRHIIYHKEILPTTHCIRLACLCTIFFKKKIIILQCFNGLKSKFTVVLMVLSLFCSAEQPNLLRFLSVINLKASVQQKRYTVARLYVIVVIGYIYHLNLLLLLLACYRP